MAKSELWGGPHDGMIVDTNPGQTKVDVPRYASEPWKKDVEPIVPRLEPVAIDRYVLRRYNKGYARPWRFEYEPLDTSGL